MQTPSIEDIEIVELFKGQNSSALQFFRTRVKI